MSENPTKTLAGRTAINIRAVAKETFAPIPWAKRLQKALTTLVGFVILVGAFALPKFLGFPWQVSLVVAGFGGWLMSKEMTVAFARFLPKTIAAIVKALGGKTEDTP